MSANGIDQDRLERLRVSRKALGLDDRSRVLSPTGYEQREPLYEDLRSLINPGFLSKTVEIDHTLFSIRTFSPGDRFLLQHRLPKGAADWEWKVWAAATFIWMVNGQIILGDPSASYRLQKHLRALRPHALNYLYHSFAGIKCRADEAIRGLMPYCYEESSRRYWRGSLGILPCREEITGIPGTSKIGLNPAQRAWIEFNTMEDEKSADQVSWQNVKAQISVHVKKEAMDKLHARDQAGRLREAESRQQEMDHYFYIATGVIQPNDTLVGNNGVRARWASTPDDLASEMRRWVEGDKDAHDRVVDEFKETARRNFEAHKRQLKEKEEMLRREAYDAPVVGVPMDLVGYSPEEIHRVLGYSKSGTAQIHDRSDDNRQTRYLQKEELLPGFEVSADGRILRADPAQTESLDDKIQGRRMAAQVERGDR